MLDRGARRPRGAALGDLRDVVRGIHPPVLADRGLTAAIEALALDLAVPGRRSTGDARRPARRRRSSPRSYFAVAECLANVGQARRAPRRPGSSSRHDAGLLTVVVGDDGRGGADPSAGHRDAGGRATAGGLRRHDEGVEPDRRADPGHAGGAVRARPRRGPRPPPGRPDPAPRGARLTRSSPRSRTPTSWPRRWREPDRRGRRARRTPAADAHRRGAAGRGRRARRAAGLPGAGALAVRRAHLRPRAARQRRGRRSATCSRTGSATSASSSTRSAGWPPAAPCSTPRWWRR